MKCGVCGDEATCLIAVKSDKDNNIIVYEGRCNTHKDMSVRKLRMLKRKQKLC